VLGSADPEFDDYCRHFGVLEQMTDKLLKDTKAFTEAVICTSYPLPSSPEVILTISRQNNSQPYSPPALASPVTFPPSSIPSQVNLT
jgi:hypothetical protein